MFDEPQDDEDRAALVFVPDIRADLLPTARYLGTNAGYAIVVYRGDDAQVCIAVYEPSTTELNSESKCVDESAFGDEGIALGYPAAEPFVQVSWGPEAGFAISPR